MGIDRGDGEWVVEVPWTVTPLPMDLDPPARKRGAKSGRGRPWTLTQSPWGIRY